MHIVIMKYRAAVGTLIFIHGSDSVPREVMRWAMRKSGVEEWRSVLHLDLFFFFFIVIYI